MPVFERLRNEVRRLFGTVPRPPALPGEGKIPAEQDTHSAIRLLEDLARDDPDAVSLLMALANLYRAGGEIERAVRIRHNLTARADQKSGFTAAAAFELSRDYLRAGVVDRALEALTQAMKLGYDKPSIQAERSRVLARSGDFLAAAMEYRVMNHPLAEAHYLVRAAEEAGRDKDEAAALRLVNKALKAYPPSLEAWRIQICMSAQAEEWPLLASQLTKARQTVEPELFWLLLESLHDLGASVGAADPAGKALVGSLAATVSDVINQGTPSLLDCYFTALLHIRAASPHEAGLWLERSLVIDPEFWPARLDLLALAAKSGVLPAEEADHITAVRGQVLTGSRFSCAVCGLRQARVFFICPRCASWYSIRYRYRFQE